MKRHCLLLIPAAMLILAFVQGCNDETQPVFSRIVVSPACGVVPLQVECYAIATGGDETGDATGGNNNLEITWNFGDGHTSRTSIAFNEFFEPGNYTVVATAKDPDGKTASTSFPVRVLADSLLIEAMSDFPSGEVTTADTVTFDLQAESCDIDPNNPDDYVKMIYKWHMNDAGNHTYVARSPRFSYEDPGQYDVVVDVTYPAWAVTRRDTLHFTVSEAP